MAHDPARYHQLADTGFAGKFAQPADAGFNSILVLPVLLQKVVKTMDLEDGSTVDTQVTRVLHHPAQKTAGFVPVIVVVHNERGMIAELDGELRLLVNVGRNQCSFSDLSHRRSPDAAEGAGHIGQSFCGWLSGCYAWLSAVVPVVERRCQ